MPKFVFTADWHLRLTRPRCRLDEDWLAFQENLIGQVVDIANENSCGIIIAGDIFDAPNVPSYIASMFIRQVSKCKEGIQFIAGNHDLPYHSIENISNSTIGIIYEAAQHHNKIYHGITCGKWLDFNGELNGADTTKLLFIHRLVFDSNKNIPPNVSAISAGDLLDEYPNYKYIFVGDNHKSFIYERKGRKVINPGSIYRGSSDQKSYKPSVYLVDTDKDKIIQIFLSDDGEVVDDSYIVEQNEKEERISAFVEKLKKNEAIELDFMKNIEKALLINKKLSKETVNMINELCNEGE